MEINFRQRKLFVPVGKILLVFFIVLVWYLWYTTSAHNKPSPSAVGTSISRIDRIGINTGRGNLLGVQPWMTPDDYRSEETFRQKVNAYLQTAKDSGLISPQKTIVILPEYLGTWLVATGESQKVYTAKTVQNALTIMVLSNPIAFAKAYWNAPESVVDKTKYAVFAMKGQEMASAYAKTFDHLAAEYEVTIVAGSLLLPAPHVENHHIVIGSGPLYNISAVFHPDGRIDPQLIKKVFPTADELPFVCPTNVADVPVFDTPIGRLGVLVCADSWNSAVYKTLKQKGTTLLAVPSFSAGDGIWKTTWKGYSGTTTPTDARADVGRITEGQAWLAHAMAGRAAPEAGITKGLNVFLRGKLWDLGSDGTTIILNNVPAKGSPNATSARPVNGALLTCLWL